MAELAFKVDKLVELFGQQFDRKFLTTLLESQQGNLEQATHYMLEIVNRQPPGTPKQQQFMQPQPPKYQPATDDLNDDKDDMSMDGDSHHHGQLPASAAPVVSSASRDQRKQQLAQLQQYLQKIGVAGMTAHERRRFFMHNPVALSDMKTYLHTIGLGGMTFTQMQEYFKQVGLSFHARQEDPARDELLRQLLTVEVKRYDNYKFGDRLSAQQKQKFFSEGYLHLKNVVNRTTVDAALREINWVLGRGFSPEQRDMFDKTTWCPEIKSSVPILDLLYESPALAYAMSLVGPVARIESGLVSVRFPGHGCIDRNDQRVRHLIPMDKPINNFMPWPHWQHFWSLDGMPSQYNQLPRGQVQNYTCTISVYLSEAPVPMNGNDVVYSGSHLVINDFFRRNGGAQQVLQSKNVLELNKLITIGNMIPLVVSPGDITISHYLLPKTIAPNISSNVRYVVNFRVYEASHVPNAFRPDSMDDMWLEYEGLREIGVYSLRSVQDPLAPLRAAALTVSGNQQQQPQQQQQPSAGQEQLKLCPNCKTATNPAAARFCSFCGRPLQ